jgi:hypothetical protein
MVGRARATRLGGAAVIYSHDAVRDAVARALLCDPTAGLDAAIVATAQALHLDVEEVRAIVQPATEIAQ